MSINQSKNKMQTPQETKQPQLEEFFFPGSGEFEPQTIRAASRAEAEKIYHDTRKPIRQKVEPSPEIKTGEQE